MKKRLCTSESVTEGHPDKMADQISDAILDALLATDPFARVACETLVASDLVVIAGEITAKRNGDLTPIVRRTIQDIGYTHPELGFEADTCTILTRMDRQSDDISCGVSEGEGLHREQGAGDQGVMIGYACGETPELMPLPITLAHQLVRRLTQLRKEGILPYLRPDGKAQVTVEYEDHHPIRVDTVIVSTHHSPDVCLARIESDIMDAVIKDTIPEEYLDERTIYHVNPTGRFVIGGPKADTGLTGRKIIVDTYGGMARHGGGAFSGKDPTKVDRSASYAARYVAKHLVAAGLADRCEVEVAYAIGVAEPVSVHIETFGTGVLPSDRLSRLVREHFALTPKGIIERLDLRRPIYRETAAYGHFGRRGNGFTWERTDNAHLLRQHAERLA